jgi:hypothetical protein
MATNNAVNVGLSGSTGTGNFVGATSATLVTPTIGAATATTVTFSPTTGGTVGTTTSDNTNAGNVGEFMSSVITKASASAFTSTNVVNLTSITLSAGDWDVWGNVGLDGTTATSIQGGISTTTGTLPNEEFRCIFTVPSGANVAGAVPGVRQSVAGSTIVYMVISGTGTGTMHKWGGIYARRVR